MPPPPLLGRLLFPASPSAPAMLSTHPAGPGPYIDVFFFTILHVFRILVYFRLFLRVFSLILHVFSLILRVFSLILRVFSHIDVFLYHLPHFSVFFKFE